MQPARQRTISSIISFEAAQHTCAPVRVHTGTTRVRDMLLLPSCTRCLPRATSRRVLCCTAAESRQPSLRNPPSTAICQFGHYLALRRFQIHRLIDRIDFSTFGDLGFVTFSYCDDEAQDCKKASSDHVLLTIHFILPLCC